MIFSQLCVAENIYGYAGKAPRYLKTLVLDERLYDRWSDDTVLPLSNINIFGIVHNRNNTNNRLSLRRVYRKRMKNWERPARRWCQTSIYLARQPASQVMWNARSLNVVEDEGVALDTMCREGLAHCSNKQHCSIFCVLKLYIVCLFFIANNNKIIHESLN